VALDRIRRWSLPWHAHLSAQGGAVLRWAILNEFGSYGGGARQGSLPRWSRAIGMTRGCCSMVSGLLQPSLLMLRFSKDRPAVRSSETDLPFLPPAHRRVG
jgi:hypothetical protein